MDCHFDNAICLWNHTCSIGNASFQLRPIDATVIPNNYLKEAKSADNSQQKLAVSSQSESPKTTRGERTIVIQLGNLRMKLVCCSQLETNAIQQQHARPMPTAQLGFASVNWVSSLWIKRVATQVIKSWENFQSFSVVLFAIDTKVAKLTLIWVLKGPAAISDKIIWLGGHCKVDTCMTFFGLLMSVYRQGPALGRRGEDSNKGAGFCYSFTANICFSRLAFFLSLQ